MTDQPNQRRLAAILAADVVEYTRHMEQDSDGTVAAWQSVRREIIDPTVATHAGKIVKLTGDGMLVEFSTVLDAVNCAVEMQQALGSSSLDFRIGISLGDVIDDGEDIHGEGVNIAARIEALAAPGCISITGSVYDQVRNRVQYPFEDRGEHNVKHVSAPVRVWQWSAGEPGPVAGVSTGDGGKLSIPDKPSIAVLPLDNIGGDPEQEYFSDGITEDIITELSKISGLFVIARHSAFIYKGQSVSLRQVGRDLGVRYVMEGSVRKSRNRMRVSVQLIDTNTDHHLWAERYDRELEDIFEVQEEVARSVAQALKVVLKPEEGERVGRPPTENIDAYDIYLRTRSSLWPPTRENLLTARSAYRRIAEMDPGFAGGHTGQSLTHSLVVMFGLSENARQDAQKALDLARAAMKIDETFAHSHSALGVALSASGQHEDAIASSQRAIDLQPGDADVQLFLAFSCLFAGGYDMAYDAISTAIRLDPRYVRGPYLNLLGIICCCAGRYQEAIEVFKRNVDRGGPIGPPALAFRTAAYSAAGQRDAAQESARELLNFFPGFRIRDFRMPQMFRDPADSERIIAALRDTGLPE